jgi:nitrogen fixation protein NifU and related proteins
VSDLKPDLDALYRETVLEHYRHPRHRAPLPVPDASALVHNPVCGDQVRVEIRLCDGRIADVAAIARGCSIAVASGSVMTELVLERATDAIPELTAGLRDLIEGRGAREGLDPRLRAFERVSALPSRRSCALLAWDALAQALASAPGRPDR